MTASRPFTMTWFEIILAIGMPASWLFVMERVKNIARGITDRAIVNHKHENDKLLEDHKDELERLRQQLIADEERRSEEFSLYARERYRSYANVYRRYRIAADAFRSFVSLFGTGYDFSTFYAEEVDRYAKQHGLTRSYMAGVRGAVDAGDRESVVKLMEKIDHKVRVRDAHRAFSKAKNAETLDELYLSDAVRLLLHGVRQRIAAVSATILVPVPGQGMLQLEKIDEMNAAVGELYLTMRSELQDGIGRRIATLGTDSSPKR